MNLISFPTNAQERYLASEHPDDKPRKATFGMHKMTPEQLFWESSENDTDLEASIIHAIAMQYAKLG